MITIEHTVSESVFVHAQVAAELTQKIKPLSSTVRLVKDNASVDANSILSIIGMAIKGARVGETVEVVTPNGNVFHLEIMSISR